MDIQPDQMRMHDFRGMARTLPGEVLGLRPDFVEHELAHAVRDPHGRAYYRTTHLLERLKKMQQWADYLDRLRTGEEAGPTPGPPPPINAPPTHPKHESGIGVTGRSGKPCLVQIVELRGWTVIDGQDQVQGQRGDEQLHQAPWFPRKGKLAF